MQPQKRKKSMQPVKQWPAIAVLFLIGVFVLLLPIALIGCASTGLTAPTTAAQTVYDIKAALVAASDIGLGYERAKCGSVVPCTAPGAAQINQAIIAADKAVNVAEAAVKANSADTSAIGAAQAAVQALQALIAQYAPAQAAPASSSTGATS